MTGEELKKKAEEYADGYATPDIEPTLRIHLYEASKEGYIAGAKENSSQWHYCKSGDYPALVDLPDGSDYNPLVLVFWVSSDDYGHKSRVFALDRWCPELKLWEDHNRRGIVAWQYLPEPPKGI